MKKENNFFYGDTYVITQKTCMLLTSFFILIISSQSSFAHGDIHERIIAVTKEIKENPDSAILYFKRGKLYSQHESNKKAIKDLKKANKLGFEGVACDLLYISTYKKMKKYKKAMAYAEKVHSYDPENYQALKFEAQILFEQGQYYKSAIHYEELLEGTHGNHNHEAAHEHKANKAHKDDHEHKAHKDDHEYNTEKEKKPHNIVQPKEQTHLPEEYLDASLAWELTDTEEGRKESIHVLEHGIEDLGELFVFQERLIDLYIKYDNHIAALDIQNKIIENSNRKESAYYRAAEICLISKDYENAKDYLNAALQSIQKLPIHIQKTEAMIDLKNRIEEQKPKL